MENVQEILPLAPAQEGMLFEAVSHGSLAGTYVGSVQVHLEGPLDHARFEAALGAAIRARDAFRACFIWEGVSQPVQMIRQQIDVPFEVLDWSGHEPGGVQDQIDLFADEQRLCAFDLKSAPLMRSHLIHLSQTSHVFVWTVHHLISDGWSTGVLLEDILKAYEGASETAAPTPFRAYLAWQKSRDKSGERNFWTEYLSGVSSPTHIDVLPSPEAPQSRFEGSIDAKTVADLAHVARSNRSTLASLLSTAWALVLRRYSGADDVLYGQTNAGRPVEIPGVDRAVGAFINTLPARLSISGDERVGDLLKRAEADAIARRRHQYASLGAVLENSSLGRGGEVFGSVFVFEDFPKADVSRSDLKVAGIRQKDRSGFPLALLVSPNDGLHVELIAAPSVVSHATGLQILADYAALLEAFCVDSDLSVSELTRMSWADPLPTLNEGPRFAPITKDLTHWAANTPDHVALTDDAGSLSYKEVEARSKAIASQLLEQGVGHGDIVPIALPRSKDVVVAMLGVLRAGAAYTPLDLEYPKERLEHIIAASKARVILAQESIDLSGSDAKLLDVSRIETSDRAFPEVEIKAEDPAYVIFTSGSQGVPKGVVISHGNLSYSTRSRASVYDRHPESFLLMSSFAFDSSVVGIFWSLANGGRLVVTRPRAEQDLAHLGTVIETHSVSHILCLPSLYQVILSGIAPGKLTSLRTVIVAGEAVGEGLVAAHNETLGDVQLFNEYGPTETSVWCSACNISGHLSGAVAIGSPPLGTAISVSDPDGIPLPKGVSGEIYVRGPGLSLGYLDQPDATATAFPNLKGERHYRTGDKGGVREDGQILFQGRQDGQVKIRGHRVELSEIDNVLSGLLGHPEVVSVLTGTAGNPRITSVIGGAGDFDAVVLKGAMAGKLPPYMVPSGIVGVEILPRLPNGKFDLKSIQSLAQTHLQTSSGESEPTSFTEKALAQIWSDVLSCETISLEDDFFDLGGDSLKTIAVALKAEEAGVHIEPFEVFEFPKLGDLSAQIHNRAEALSVTEPERNLAVSNLAGDLPIFFMIHGSLRMYSYLSANLGAERPMGFLFSHFFGGDISPQDRIEHLVDEAYEKLKSLKGTGPYNLGGYSLGGIIALELAARLRDEGDEVASLFLLDPSFDVARPLDSGADQSGSRRHKVKQNVLGRAMMAISKASETIGGGDKNRARMSYVGNAYRRILTYYRPSIYQGKTIVMLTPDSEKEIDQAGWMDLALPNASRYSLPFEHLELQKDPDALMAWTSKLTAILKNAEA